MITPNIRGYDNHGAGHYQASRGKRVHNGLDFLCDQGDEVATFTGGFVTKIGYPYNPANIHKGHLRYVEMTDKMGLKCRYFYIVPHVSVGDLIKPGDIVGSSQNLMNIYPGITQHFHFEVMVVRGKFINPHEYFAING